MSEDTKDIKAYRYQTYSHPLHPKWEHAYWYGVGANDYRAADVKYVHEFRFGDLYAEVWERFISDHGSGMMHNIGQQFRNLREGRPVDMTELDLDRAYELNELCRCGALPAHKH